MDARKLFKVAMGNRQTLVREFNNRRVDAIVGGRQCKFRSKLEYNWSLWCQLRQDQGLIADWQFEDKLFRFANEKCGAVKYLVDFTIVNIDGSVEYEECKGYLSGRDRSKLRKVQKHYPGTRISLVMSRVPKRQSNALRIASKYVERIIDSRDIFKQLKGILEFI